MKLFKNAVALLMVLCMLVCMPVFGFAVDTGTFDVICRSDDGKTLTVTVYAQNYVGLKSGSIDLRYYGGVKYDHASMGDEAGKVNDSADNGFWTDMNNTVAGRVIYGFYFKEYLWDADTFAAHGENGRKLDINVASFDIVTFTFQLDGAAYEISVDIYSKSYDGDNLSFSYTLANAGVTPGTDEPSGNSNKLGDVNGDGEIGSDDARLALRASVKLEHYDPSSAQFYAADVNNDGKIGSDDARSILRISVRLAKVVGKNVIGYDPLTGEPVYSEYIVVEVRRSVLYEE